MNSRVTEIQTLIADIDNLLANKGKRLARVLANPGQEPRLVLERTRDFLVKLAESESNNTTTENQRPGAAQLTPLLARYIGGSDETLPSQNPLPSSNSPEGQNYLSSLIEPLQSELQALLSERKNLVEEIRQLEQQRLHNYSLAQQMANQEQMISEFLQVLTNRVSGYVMPQAPFMYNAPGLLAPDTNPAIISNPAITITPTAPSSEQAERIANLASDLDQKLISLDSTVNIVFEALQRNIHNHQESLSQSFLRMQNQGAQGEDLLKALIEKLVQQLQVAPQVVKSTQRTGDSRTNELPELDLSVIEDNNDTPDLDALLLELHQGENQASTTPENPPSVTPPPVLDETSSVVTNLTSPLSPNNTLENPPSQVANFTSQPQGDEVDNLYASLFGVENNTAANVTPIANPITRNPISITQDLSTPRAATDEPEVEENLFDLNIDNQDSILATDANENINIINISTATTDEETSVISNQSEILDTSNPPFQETTDDSTNNIDISTLRDSQTPPVVAQNQVIAQSHQVADISLPQEDLPTIGEVDITTLRESTPVEAPIISNLESPEPVLNLEENVTAFLPDPWFDNSDGGLLDLHDLQNQKNRTTVAAQTSNGWEKFVNLDNAANITLSPIPEGDTVTALTDLSFAENSALVNNITEPEPSNSYIAASVSENLLSHAEAQIDAAMPDIALDDEQLQKLDQDLVNFDSEQSLVSATTKQTAKSISKSTSPVAEPEIIVRDEPPVLDTSFEKLAEVLVPADENLIETTQTNALVPASNSTDIFDTAPDNQETVWYLGIDFGTTGISAALLNRTTTEVYPLYWSAENDSDASGAKRSFRLPAEVYLPPGAGTPITGETEVTSKDSTNPQPTPNLFSAELKPYLQIALPYRSEKQRTIPITEENSSQESTLKWEPVLQLNEVATVPLVWMVRSLSKLLLTLKSDRNSTTLGLTASAMGLNQQSFRNIIDDIAGIICSCPSSWSEQYRFNIREALLLSKLVPHPQQVFFVEEAIASLISELDGANGEEVKLNSKMGSRLAKSSDHPLVGNTLVMNIGASATEMALTELPESLLELAHSDFMLHSFSYGGKSIEQDIVCQLLLPPKWRQSKELPKSANEPISSKPWHWQPSIPGLEKLRLSSLRWEELTLPRPGEPDVVERIRLLQRLESSRLGKALLDAAGAMKLVLQHQDSFSLELADQRWLVQRRDLESQVFVPFVRRLNRELNRLLVARGIPTEAINQAILTGGVASLGAVSRWLRQKLPNARIIQDLYLGENGAPTCSRVAYGLCLLPLHPQVLEVPRQQYTDYFLFTELLRLLPERALSFGEVIQLFEARGINTRSCQQRLLAFLEGELPAGLVPNSIDSLWLTQSSVENSDYKAMASTPLFEKQGSLTYRPNNQQVLYLRRYLDAMKNSTQQSLEEPYTVNFAIGVENRE